MAMDPEFALVYALFAVIVGLIVGLSFLEQPTRLRRTVRATLVVVSATFLIAFGVLIQSHPYSSYSPGDPRITLPKP